MNDSKHFTHFIFLSKTGDSLAVAWQLQRQGHRVLVGIVDDVRNAESKEQEDKETKRRRTSMYKDILNVMSAEKLISKMRSFPNKEKWFVFVDFNSMWEMAQEALKIGYVNGLFPSKFDFNLEGNRQMGKEFVEKFYPGIEVAPHQDFKSIEEGIEYINDSEDFLALKSNDPDGPTTVPKDKNIEFAKQTLIDALIAHKECYERKGFSLENQIRNGTEVCGESVYYDGKKIFSSVDIENKEIGDENTGKMTGCMQNLVVSTDMESELNLACAPDAMDKLAKKHKGMFFCDLNVIYKDGKYYYLEHCGNRPGYDAFVTEIEMSGGATEFFNSLSDGEAPFKSKFGYALRGLNMNQDKDNLVKENLTMRWRDEDVDHIFPFEIQKHHAKMVSTGYGIDMVVFCASSNDYEYAIKNVHEVRDNFSFKELYTRARQDSLSISYPTSIINRYESIKSKLECEVEDDNS